MRLGSARKDLRSRLSLGCCRFVAYVGPIRFLVFSLKDPIELRSLWLRPAAAGRRRERRSLGLKVLLRIRPGSFRVGGENDRRDLGS